MKKARTKRTARNRVLLLLAGILLLGGIGIIAYPHVLQWWYGRQATQAYESFVRRAENVHISPAPDNPLEPPKVEQLPPDTPYQELYEQMLQYNEKIFADGQSGLSDPWAYEQPSFNLTEYGFDENCIGYIEIPRLEVVLPIYLGADVENMKKGAVHLSQTSLPLGGKNTACVIAAHRNLYTAEMFTNLPELENGDEVIITNLWYSMTYRVTDSAVILADEIDSLYIQEGKDMLCLFTCYYQADRKDRFVVYCERYQ